MKYTAHSTTTKTPPTNATLPTTTEDKSIWIPYPTSSEILLRDKAMITEIKIYELNGTLVSLDWDIINETLKTENSLVIENHVI